MCRPGRIDIHGRQFRASPPARPPDVPGLLPKLRLEAAAPAPPSAGQFPKPKARHSAVEVAALAFDKSGGPKRRCNSSNHASSTGSPSNAMESATLRGMLRHHRRRRSSSGKARHRSKHSATVMAGLAGRLVARTGIESKACQEPNFGNTQQTRVNTGRNRLSNTRPQNRTTAVKPNLSEDFLSYFVMQDALRSTD